MTPWVDGDSLPFFVAVPPDSDETWVDGDYLAFLARFGDPVDGFLWTAEGVAA